MSNRSAHFAERYGPWAVVAGASEGMGRAYCLQLADRGLSVFMIARQAERLEAVADEVRARGVEARTLSLDLASEDLLSHLEPHVGELEVGLLVYNAGLSTQNHYFETDLAQHLQMINVNCRGPVLLSHHFGRAMATRRRGGIILMSSAAGFVGSGLNALYAATKAFDTVLGEGIARDIAHQDVDILSMVAGATRTPEFERSQKGSSPTPIMAPDDVVREALDSLGRTSMRVAGLNKIAVFLLQRLLPRRLATSLLTKASYDLSGHPRPGA
jgi:short-subunit dehydrogenase